MTSRRFRANPFRAPKPLLILIPSNLSKKTGFSVGKASRSQSRHSEKHLAKKCWLSIVACFFASLDFFNTDLLHNQLMRKTVELPCPWTDLDWDSRLKSSISLLPNITLHYPTLTFVEALRYTIFWLMFFLDDFLDDFVYDEGYFTHIRRIFSFLDWQNTFDMRDQFIREIARRYAGFFFFPQPVFGGWVLK